MSTTQEFTVDGVRQVYHVAGDGPVMIAHSGGPGIGYGYLRSPELEEQFTMVYLEPVGTGASGRLEPSGYTMATYVRFLDALVGHLEVPAVRLLGHSYGGFVAQRYALEHPDRVAGLALYDTSPVTGPEFWDAAMAGLFAYPARFPDVPAAADIPDAFQRAVSAPDDDTLRENLRAAIPAYFADFWGRRAEFEPMVAQVRAWAAPATAPDPEPFDVRDRLGEIAVPTVVLAGEHDFICGPRWARLIHQGVAGSELVVFENSGHFAHLEQPADFAKAVTGKLLP
jgi:pimeloyl-ACP methyl ester carboxylesterase